MITHEEILERVQWQDLKHLSRKEMLIENNLSIPWAITSWTLAYYGFYWIAIPFSALFFITALRQVHNGLHNALGTNGFLTWLSLYLNSVLMMASFHAVKFNHLRHHRYCLTEKDQEGKSAHMTWYQAILYGPIHMFKIHQLTWVIGSKEYKRNMIFELSSIALVIFTAIFFDIHWLQYHIVFMIIGEFLMSFFAAWTVHHDTQDHPHLARTQRNKWKNKISFGMFYHMEHHLFPSIPTIKMPELARRIDDAIPEIEKKDVF